MKKLHLILIFLTTTLYSQNIKVSYVQTYNYDFQQNHLLELFINTNENTTAQITHFENVETNKKKNDATNVLSASIDRKVKFNYLLFDFNKKSMQTYTDFARRFYEIEDAFPIINWQLLNEQKIINNIPVNKAIGTYRGKKWEVWYAPSLPYNVGPWKLNGLPGLIISAKDETNNNYFVIKKIEYNKPCVACNVPMNLIDNKVTKKEFLLIQDDLLNALGRDSSRNLVLSGDKINFLDLETEFEFPIEFSWEEKK